MVARVQQQSASPGSASDRRRPTLRCAAVSSPSFVRLRDVSYSPAGSGVTLLEGVSLELPRTGLALLVGRSGSGKTTLLSLLAGLCEPSKGSVCVGDAAEHTPAPLRAQRVGCVFQFPERHFLGETLAQELTFGWPRAETAGARATRAADAQRVLRACGLAQLALDAPLRSLSGGQQRRLALAVQLLRRPPLLLLDEPLAGLDWRARVALLPLLCAVARSRCVLAVTHDTQLLKPRATAGRWRMHAGELQREEDACADC